MKKLLIFLCATFILFSMSGIAEASYFFDFEDGVSTYGPLNGLETYMENIFGSDIDIDNAKWWGESAWVHSDILYTPFVGNSATIDFDPLPNENSDFKILSLWFTWLVRTDTKSYDFVMEGYDDVTSHWQNYFTANCVGDYASGSTGLITFDNDLEITRLRIHDGWLLSVGMDDLTINTVPIPSTVWIFGAGLVSLVGIRRKLRN